jgi:hypothetical protein
MNIRTIRAISFIVLLMGLSYGKVWTFRSIGASWNKNPYPIVIRFEMDNNTRFALESVNYSALKYNNTAVYPISNSFNNDGYCKRSSDCFNNESLIGCSTLSDNINKCCNNQCSSLRTFK